MPPRPAISTGLRPGLTPPPGQSYTGADGSKEAPVRVLKGRAIGVTYPRDQRSWRLLPSRR